VEVRKECIDETLSFTLEKIKRDTIVFHTSRSASTAQSRARCVQVVEVLYFSKSVSG
jgi:hypothetical protein